MERQFSYLGILIVGVLLCGTSAFAQPYWCPDLTEDGFVDFYDFARFSINWQQTGSRLEGDFDDSGTVDFNDAAHITYYWLSDEFRTVIYVDAAADGNDDGTSWYDAYADLQDALSDANNGCMFYEIWVAEGTYKPTSDFNRVISFELKPGVALYGGFAGTETSSEQRNWAYHKTILSGDIGTPNDINDNSYRVIIGADRSILDGFTITKGYASVLDPDDSNSCGGGIYCAEASMTINNCIITDNSAASEGGGMFDCNSSLMVTNCFFIENDANFGGGMCDVNSSPTIINCVFSRNLARIDGGGMDNYNSSPILINCTFSSNYADSNGGAMDNYSYGNIVSSPNVINCIFWGSNAAGLGNEIYNSELSDPNFSFCNIQGCGGSAEWDLEFGSDDGNNIESDPHFLDSNSPAGLDGIFGTFDDGLRLKIDSNCIDAADGNAAPLTDIIGLDRVDINDVYNIGAGDPNYTDIGAYESYSGYGYDTDGDGLWDYEEYILGTNPNDSDSDNDELSDGDEFNIYHTNPLSKDSDGDGLSDFEELFVYHTNPVSSDSDSDGMPDGWEVAYGLNPLDDSDADDDPDGDGRTNLEESIAGTHPFVYTAISVTVYEYDNASQVTKEITQGEHGNNVAVAQYKYDELGRRWQERRWADSGYPDDANDMITLTSYDVRGNIKKTVRKGTDNTDPEVIESGDLVMEDFYDALGRLTDVNDPNGGNTHYTYYTGGQLYQVTDPNNNTTTNEYDNAGRLAKVTNAEGHYRVSSYDSLGRTTKQIAYDSSHTALMQTRFEYDGLGHITRRAVMANAGSTLPIDTGTDMVTDYYYADSNGQLVSETKYYASGTPATTTYGYDGLGRQNRTIDPAGNQTLLVYDKMDRLEYRQQIDVNPLGGDDLTMTTCYFYDSLDRVYMQVEMPDVNNSNTWHATAYSYDALGNRTAEVRPDGVVTTHGYNALGLPFEKIADVSTGHINQKTEYGYDRLGRQTSITGYADSITPQATSYTYDDLDRITKVTYPDGNSINFVYNATGRVIKCIDQRGIVTTYTYDGTYNMLAKIVDGNSVTDNANETFTYDGLGRMLTAAKMNTISQTEFIYNDIGKITDTNETLFNATTKTIHYTYDEAGYPTSVVYPGGTTVNITPDWQGRLNTIKIGGTTLATYKYIGSRVAQRTYPLPAVTYQPTYDNLGRITSVDSGTAYAKFDYQYELYTYNISKQTYDHRIGDPCTVFSYDYLNRLTVAEYGIQDNNEAFTMDKLGNRTNVNLRDGSNEVYSVDNLTNRYITVDSDNLSYDAAGNLTKDRKGYEYEYDYENRIVKITKDSNNIAEFAYDALGQRIQKIDSIVGTTTRYYHNNNWQVMCEYDANDAYQRQYIYGNYIDEILLTRADTNDYYYVHDHLYSPAALTDASGAVLERYEYDAYGKVQILNSNFEIRDSSLYSNRYFFAGREMDTFDNGNLKIQYNRNRYYDNSLGRWLIHDPLGINPAGGTANPFAISRQYTDGLNLYEYCANNPFKFTDPMGVNCSSGFCVIGTSVMGEDLVAKILRFLGFEHVDISYNGKIVYRGSGGSAVRRTQEDISTMKVEIYYPLSIAEKGKLKYGKKADWECKCMKDEDILDCIRNKPSKAGANCQGDVMDATRACCLKGFWTVVGTFFPGK